MTDWSFYDRGFSLFPLKANDKRPAISTWEIYQTQRPSAQEVQQWAAGKYNTGIATGAVSGIIVLDADGPDARQEAERRGIPPTLTVGTPRGTHWYFQHPGWPVSNRVGGKWCEWDRPGLDLRGDGGYVVGPGSYYVPSDDERAKGKIEGGYRVETDVPIALAPDWLLALTWPKQAKPPTVSRMAEETSLYGRRALHAEIAILGAAGPGELNNQINLSAFAVAQLVAGGEITDEEGWRALEEALAALGVDGEEKAMGTLLRGWTAGQEVPRSPEPAARPLTALQILGPRGPVAVEARQALIRGQMIWHDRMDDLFADCWFVQKMDVAYMKGVGILSPTSFDTVLGGFQFPTDIEGKAKTRSAWDAFRLSPSWKCPIVYDICFRPDKTPGCVVEEEGRPFINTYEPIVTKRINGDASRFLDFLAKLLPVERDRQILQSYMCSLVQNPGRKFQWWPVIQGVQGNGKTLLLTVLQHAVGKRYTHLVNPDAMGKTGNQFNAWVQGNLLVGVEEIFVSDQRHILETFKPIVTNERTSVEGKGKDQTTGDNFANGLLLTNHRDGVPINDKDRRYSILWTAQQESADLARDGMDGTFFPDLYDWMRGRGAYAALGESYGLAIVNDWLRTTAPIALFDPAGLCQRAPETSSTAMAIEESLGLLEQEVQEAIECGLMGFRGGVVSSLAMRTLFDRLRKTIAPKRYQGIMKALGYASHPMLAGNRGRFASVLQDGQRPVLYYLKGSSYFAIGSNEELKAATEKALFNGTAPGENIEPIRPPPLKLR